MNPEIKKKWVDALNSGEYKQGRHRLRSLDDEYCCLGVLCDLHSKETGHPWDEYNDKAITAQSYYAVENLLPATVANWAEVIQDPYIKDGLEDGNYLTTMNDNGMSFNEIATEIEKHL